MPFFSVTHLPRVLARCHETQRLPDRNSGDLAQCDAPGPSLGRRSLQQQTAENAQRSAVRDHCDASICRRLKHPHAAAFYAFAELAFGFTPRRSAIPRVFGPSVAVEARDLMPRSSFPRAEVQFLQTFHDLHSATIASCEGGGKLRTALRRARVDDIHGWCAAQRLRNVGGCRRCERQVQPAVANAGLHFARRVTDQDKFHAARRAR